MVKHDSLARLYRSFRLPVQPAVNQLEELAGRQNVDALMVFETKQIVVSGDEHVGPGRDRRGQGGKRGQVLSLYIDPPIGT